MQSFVRSVMSCGKIERRIEAVGRLFHQLFGFDLPVDLDEARILYIDMLNEKIAVVLFLALLIVGRLCRLLRRCRGSTRRSAAAA